MSNLRNPDGTLTFDGTEDIFTKQKYHDGYILDYWHGVLRREFNAGYAAANKEWQGKTDSKESSQ